MKIKVLLTCYNRKEKTLQCLRRLYQVDFTSIGVDTRDVVLVDDGSTDGTGEAVRSEFKDITIIQGDGQLYWGGGMRKAMKHIQEMTYDYIFWLNDDTMLYPDAFRTMIEDMAEGKKQSGKPAIISGCTVDPRTNKVSYGGFNKSIRAQYTGKIIKLEEMNGNFVMIPKEIVDKIGVIESVFRHGLGDIDYSGRALKAGYQVYLSRQPIGTCENNRMVATWIDPSLPLMERYKSMNNVKGVPFKALLLFSKRYGGILWPLKVVKPYMTIFYTSLKYMMTGKGGIE